MPQKSFRDALNEAMHLEMERDSSVIVLGEDVSGGAGGTSGNREASGGMFGVTKGLLIQAIRDDPVMFFEHKALYPRKGEVPDSAHTIAFGEANLLREGEHVAAKGFRALKAAPRMVTAPHTPVPFARELERACVPGPARIEAAIRAAMQD